MGKKLTEEYKEKLRIGMRDRVRKLKQLALDYKGGKCEICGYDKCPQAMHFHHKDPNEKDFSLSNITCRTFNETIRKELDKCQLLCSNCHAEIHWEENSQRLKDRKAAIEALNLPVRSKAQIIRCEFCNKEFTRAKSHMNSVNFCSVKCKNGKANLGWPEESELIKLFLTKTAKQIAEITGKNFNSVKKRKQKLKKLGKM